MHSNPMFKPTNMQWSIEEFMKSNEATTKESAKRSFKFAKGEFENIIDNLSFNNTAENKYVLKLAGMDMEKIKVDQFCAISTLDGDDEIEKTEAQKTIERVQEVTSVRLEKSKLVQQQIKADKLAQQ